MLVSPIGGVSADNRLVSCTFPGQCEKDRTWYAAGQTFIAAKSCVVVTFRAQHRARPRYASDLAPPVIIPAVRPGVNWRRVLKSAIRRYTTGALREPCKTKPSLNATAADRSNCQRAADWIKAALDGP